MQINYALPIIKQTQREIMKMIDENQSAYRYFEIWLDYIRDLDDEFVNNVMEKSYGKIIILFRRKFLETMHMNIEKRKHILGMTSNQNVFIDIDVMEQEEELRFLQSENLSVQTIVSYHNYQETPGKNDLRNIVKKMEQYNPTMYKIATMCKTEQDALQLLELLLQLKQEGKKYIVLGMGEKGIVTRIFGTLWGNEMIFAPKETTEISAPGQMTKEQLDIIFETLNT